MVLFKRKFVVQFYKSVERELQILIKYNNLMNKKLEQASKHFTGKNVTGISV